MIVTAIRLIMNAIQKDEGDLEYLGEQPIFRGDGVCTLCEDFACFFSGSWLNLFHIWLLVPWIPGISWDELPWVGQPGATMRFRRAWCAPHSASANPCISVPDTNTGKYITFLLKSSELVVKRRLLAVSREIGFLGWSYKMITCVCTHKASFSKAC